MRNEETVRIEADSLLLDGSLGIPGDAEALVIFAHGSGSSRHSVRNKFVAKVLREAGIGTLLFDLLTAEEDTSYQNRFDIPMLISRLVAATKWIRAKPQAECFGTKALKLGYFGASTGAAAAIGAAAALGPEIGALVSRGGRPDLAMDALGKVQAPTLLIVGEQDDLVIELNRQAFALIKTVKELSIVPGATHLFEEPGALEEVAHLATQWFSRHLVRQKARK